MVKSSWPKDAYMHQSAVREAIILPDAYVSHLAEGNKIGNSPFTAIHILIQKKFYRYCNFVGCCDQREVLVCVTPWHIKPCPIKYPDIFHFHLNSYQLFDVFSARSQWISRWVFVSSICVFVVSYHHSFRFGRNTTIAQLVDQLWGTYVLMHEGSPVH